MIFSLKLLLMTQYQHPKYGINVSTTENKHQNCLRDILMFVLMDTSVLSGVTAEREKKISALISTLEVSEII